MRKISVLLAVLIMLAGCGTQKDGTQTVTQTVIDLNTPVTRGQAIKMLALSRCSIDGINTLPREIAPMDSDISNWCDKYINAAVHEGLISGTQENTILQNDMLTLEQANFILKKAGGGRNLVLRYSEEDRKKPISLDVWLQAFDAIDDNCTQREIVLLADKTLCPELSDGYVLSSEGLLGAEGIEIRPEYFLKPVQALMRDSDILALKEITDGPAVIKNAVVEEVCDNGITANIAGCHMFFPCDANALGLAAGTTAELKLDGGIIAEAIR